MLDFKKLREIRSTDLSTTKSKLREQFLTPIEEEFHSFFNDFWSMPRKALNHGYPKLDVYENNNNYVVEYAMAGVDKDKISIEITEDKASEFAEFGTRTLKVSGGMEQAFEHNKNSNYHVKELTRKSFSRSLILPDYVIGDPKAVFQNGVLTLTFSLPVKEEPNKPHTKSIPIVDAEEGK